MRDGTIKHMIYFDGQWYEVLSQAEVASELGVTRANVVYHIKNAHAFNTITDVKGIKWIVKDTDYERWKEKYKPQDCEASQAVNEGRD